MHSVTIIVIFICCEIDMYVHYFKLTLLFVVYFNKEIMSVAWPTRSHHRLRCWVDRACVMHSVLGDCYSCPWAIDTVTIFIYHLTQYYLLYTIQINLPDLCIVYVLLSCCETTSLRNLRLFGEHENHVLRRRGGGGSCFGHTLSWRFNLKGLLDY